ncbi:hypothetical protein H6503_02350 [Candidatus Woesearchaeota archaeon]|nr:hypothetical protein [Candidatus Woesearchaeota archaeon]
MGNYRNILQSDKGIERSVVVDSRDLVSKEKYEEHIDKKLAKLIKVYHKTKVIDSGLVNQVVSEFINDVKKIIQELEEMKRKEEQEEFRRIQEIEQLIEITNEINIGELRKRLGDFEKHLAKNTIAAIKSEKRRERKVARGRTPFGFVMKKLQSDANLDKKTKRKAKDMINNTNKEHELVPRVRDAIEQLKSNPSLEQQKSILHEVRKLITQYKKDLNDFLCIETNIEIEEARKIHRIDHYVKFLRHVKNFDNLVRQLEELKKRAEQWVYQDSIDMKRLLQYSIKLDYGAKQNELSQKEDIENVKVERINIGGVPALYIYHPEINTNRGIVFQHGITGNKENYITLAKRMVLQGYRNVSIDMTAHGEDRNNFRLGKNSEYIHIAAAFLRSRGCSNIGVVGHSAGAASAIFAMSGYNSDVEERWFHQVTLLKEHLEHINKKVISGTIDQYKINEFIHLAESYQQLKQIIVEALDKMYKSNSKIDCAVLMAAPLRFQKVFPENMSRKLKQFGKGAIRKRIFRMIGYLGTKAAQQMEKKNQTDPEMYHKYNRGQGTDAQLKSWHMISIYDTFDYIEKLNNPYDFISALIFLASKTKYDDNKTSFFKYYYNYIRKIPKFAMYGISDEVLKPLEGSNMKELDEHYTSLGLIKKNRYWNLYHAMSKENDPATYEIGKHQQITRDIMIFLNDHLGKGSIRRI